MAKNWPFATDFDWEALPADPRPAAWVRPWQHIEAMRHAQDQEAFREYVHELEWRDMAPEFGICPTTESSLVGLPVPLDMALEEMTHQSLFLEHEGLRLRVTRSPLPVAGQCPLTAPVGLVSLSLPNGSRRPAELGVTAGALDAHARWTDRMIAGTIPESVQRALAWGHPVFTVWRPGPGNGVLEIRDRHGAVLLSQCARLTRAHRSCPMIAGACPGQLCRAYGGPWVSKSILAFGRWSRQRGMRLQDVGCDTCGDGRVRLGVKTDAGIMLAPPQPLGDEVGYGAIPSRFTEVIPRDALADYPESS